MTCDERIEALLNRAGQKMTGWMYCEDDSGQDGWKCMNCGFFEPWYYNYTDDNNFIRNYKYCPGCGSKKEWNDEP